MIAFPDIQPHHNADQIVGFVYGRFPHAQIVKALNKK